MPGLCSVCALTPDERAGVNAKLVEGELSQRAIARLFGLNHRTVNRHARLHLPKIIAAGVRAAQEQPHDAAGPPTASEQGKEAQEPSGAAQAPATPPVITAQAASPVVQHAHAENTRAAVDFARNARTIHAAGLRVLQEAQAGADLDMQLKAIGRLVKTLELWAKVEGELSDAPTVNVLINPQWIELRTTILAALDRHPDARRDVMRAIEEAHRHESV